MMYTITNKGRTHYVPREFWTECCFVLSNGMKCNWAFFNMLHEFGFIGTKGGYTL